MLIIEKKDVLVLSEGATDELGDITVTAEVKHSNDIPRLRKKTC